MSSNAKLFIKILIWVLLFFAIILTPLLIAINYSA